MIVINDLLINIMNFIIVNKLKIVIQILKNIILYLTNLIHTYIFEIYHTGVSWRFTNLKQWSNEICITLHHFKLVNPRGHSVNV